MTADTTTDTTTALPPVVDADTWQRELDALRARADAEAGRIRTELETLGAELTAARLRSLPPDELRALLVDALAARPDGTPSSPPR